MDRTEVRRLQLAEEAQANLDSEIEMLRKAMREFTRAVRSKKAQAYPEKLSKSLDLLGLTCSRLANVMRVNMALHLSDQDPWKQEMMVQLNEFVKEWQGMNQETKAVSWQKHE